jgi:hypothetical protein
VAENKHPMLRARWSRVTGVGAGAAAALRQRLVVRRAEADNIVAARRGRKKRKKEKKELTVAPRKRGKTEAEAGNPGIDITATRQTQTILSQLNHNCMLPK